MSDIRFNGWLHRSGTGGVWQDSSGNVGIGSSVPSNAAVSANTKVLNVGVITATTYYGSGANLTGITGTTINNNANDRLITGSDTANTLEGESTLFYATGFLTVNESAGTSANGARLDLKFGNNNSTDVISSLTFSNGAGEAARIQGETSGANNNGVITFHTDDGGTSAERLRIDNDGKCIIPDNGRFSAGAGEDLYLYSDGTQGIIRAPNSNLHIQSDAEVIIGDIGGNEIFGKFADDGVVSLYSDNTKVFATTSTGIDVWGAEGGDCNIHLSADEGDDDDDKWRLNVAAGGGFSIDSATSGSWEEKMNIAMADNGPIVCCAVDSGVTNGGISLGNANIGGKWYATGNTTASLFMFFNPANGNVGSIKTNAAATSFNTSSDYRLKENEVPLENAITKLKALKPYTFNFKTYPSDKVDGFYAHEAAEVVPTAVTGTKDEMAPTYYKSGDTIPEGKKVGDWTGQYSSTEINPQGVDYGKFTPLLTKALQELVARVEALESA